MRFLIIIKLYFVIVIPIMACNIAYANDYDALTSLFDNKCGTYTISKDYHFIDTIQIPANASLRFEGGSLCGPIVFDRNYLIGDIKLQGSYIFGTLTNSVFEADWICFKDGIRDDANNINMILNICGSIHFGIGTYRLITQFIPPEDMDDHYRNMISSHIGIHRSDVSLVGEVGTVLATSQPLGIICAYTSPYNIDNSISNILIKNINFKTANDGILFHQVQHTIKSIGINGFVVDNCVISDFWGDAICLCHYGDHPGTGEMIRNQNVKITNNKIYGGLHHNTRNGIAIISGQNVLIDNNLIMNTTKDGMPGAIDIEANNSAFTIENITVSNNIIEGCKGTAGGICVNANDRRGPARNIIIVGNVIKSCYSGLAFVVKSDYTTDSYIIANNIVDFDTPPFLFVGTGKSSNWIITGNIFKRHTQTSIPGMIKIQGLVIENNIFGLK